MEAEKRALGQEHSSILASMGSLASIFWNQGRWREAEELEVQVGRRERGYSANRIPLYRSTWAASHRHFGTRGGGRRPKSWRCRSWRRERGTCSANSIQISCPAWTASHRHTGTRGDEGGQEAGGACHEDEKVGTQPRASLYIDQHEQPRSDTSEPGALEGGRRAGARGASHGDGKGGSLSYAYITQLPTTHPVLYGYKRVVSPTHVC